MPDWLEVIFDLVAQFTGGREPAGDNIVWFGIAAFCWAVLISIAYAKVRRSHASREGLLFWAFGLGLVRELLMIFVKSLDAIGLVDHHSLHVAFPPIEHTLQNVAMIVAAAAFMRFVTNETAKSNIFLRAGILANVGCYFATFLWWGTQVQQHPELKFGHTWCDVLFHLVMSLLLSYAIAFLWGKSSGWLRNVVCSAFLFLFLFQFLKLPDIFTDEVHVTVYAPIRHSSYLIGIILLGYVYVRELASELDKSYEREQLSSLGKAMTGLVHESRNALARSQAGLRLLARQLGDRPELFRYIEESLAAQKDVQQLFESVQNYATPRRINETWCAVDRVVNTAWEKLASTTTDRRAELHQMIDGVDTHCRIDTFSLEGAFRNLLENSLAAGKDPVHIHISYRRIELNKRGFLEVTYHDNGPGISPTTSEKVFDAFFTTKTQGTGLGLAIAKQTVEGHGGSIRVVTQNGSGATFVITLPQPIAGTGYLSTQLTSTDQPGTSN